MVVKGLWLQNGKPGDIMYKDLNGDGKISSGAGTLEDHGDLKYLGDNQSHYLFGIDINADWKGFDFRCFFQGVLKHNVWQSDGYFGVPIIMCGNHMV